MNLRNDRLVSSLTSTTCRPGMKSGMAPPATEVSCSHMRVRSASSSAPAATMCAHFDRGDPAAGMTAGSGSTGDVWCLHGGTASVAHVGEWAVDVVGAEPGGHVGFDLCRPGVLGDAPSDDEVGMVGELRYFAAAWVADRLPGTEATEFVESPARARFPRLPWLALPMSTMRVPGTHRSCSSATVVIVSGLQIPHLGMALSHGVSASRNSR